MAVRAPVSLAAAVLLGLVHACCTEPSNLDDAAGLSDLGEMPSQVHDAFRVSGSFHQMPGVVGDDERLPDEDLEELTTTPLEAAEKDATGELEPLLGDAGPTRKSEDPVLEGIKDEHRLQSKGTLLKSHGKTTLTDFVTVESPKQGSSAQSMRQRAANDAAALNDPVRESELQSASLIEMDEGEGAAWGGRRRSGSPDEGEEQKRPGWQLRYPGIELKVETANYVTDGDSHEEHELPEVDAQDLDNKQALKHTKADLKAAPRFNACFKDGVDHRVLPEGMGAGKDGTGIGLRGVMGGDKPSDMEPLKCAYLCQDYALMGLQTIGDDTFCYCGSSTGLAERAAASECDKPCAGNPAMTCGAPLRVSVYVLKSKDGDAACWDGSAKLEGHDTEKKWHQYRKCTTCSNLQPTPGEKWQLWGKTMELAMFAGCMSCEPESAFVMVDPIKRVGFCRDYNPAVDKVVTYTYPYYAHWDAKSEFVHTKFVQKYTVPKVRRGKAAAVCSLYKQVRCELSEEAKLRSWQKEIGKSRQLSGKPAAVQRFLECHTSKVVKCNKVCVARKENLGRNPDKEEAECGPGGVEVSVGDDGLKGQLGKEMKGLNGVWCCFNGCQVPPEHSTYKEDGSYWCKDELISW